MISPGGSEAEPSVAAPVPVQKDFVQNHNVYGKWHSSAMGGGGFMQNVVPCPTDAKRFYSYEDVGGVYRSDDGGTEWRMMHGGLPAEASSYQVRGLVVDPRNADKILIAVGNSYDKKHAGIFASDDGGVTWAKVLTAYFNGNGNGRADGFILDRDPANPDVLVAASLGDGVFKTGDNGKTWQRLGQAPANAFPNPLDVRFDRTNSKQLWLCDAGDKTSPAAFRRSTDGGETWVNLTGPAPVADPSRVLDPANLAGLVPSEILQDPVDGKTLYGIFKTSLIARSQDAGATWQAFSDGLDLKLDQKSQPGISETGYAALAAGPDFIVTATRSYSTFFKLKSGETKWERITHGPPEIGDWWMKRLGGKWWFGGNNGSITVDPHDPNHWFMTDFHAIWQSHDSGQSWAATNNGIEATVTHCFLQDPSDPQLVHLGQADIGPFYSTDAGERFQRGDVPDTKSAPAGGKNMKCIDMCPKDPTRLYGVADRTYLDGWTVAQVFLSEDKGRTWTRQPMEGLPPDMKKRACTSIAADLNDPQVAYLGVAGQVGTKPGAAGVYKTTDGAKSWTNISQGLPEGKFYFPYDAFNGGRQLAASGDGSLIAISTQSHFVYRFDPATQTWISCDVAGKGLAYSVAADRLKPGRYFVALRGGGVYRTDDSGATWKAAYPGDASYVVTDAAVPGRVAAGTSHGVILSTDGGDTWTELDPSLPFRKDNVPCFVGERLVVGSAGSGVFWIDLPPSADVAAKP